MQTNNTDENDKGKLLQKSMIWLDSATTGEQAYVVFRKQFELKKRVNNAELRIFADTRYILWINGKYVERGPCRFDPKRPGYDILDITPYLRVGCNVIAVLVHHYPIGNFTKWWDQCARMMDHSPGLTAALEILFNKSGKQLIVTDSSWKASKNTMYQNVPGEYNSVPDNIDARRNSGDWTSCLFDDSKWESASAVDGNKWGKIIPRPIALLRETTIIPRNIIKETVEEKTDYRIKELAKILPITMETAHELVIDVGKTVQAYSVLEFNAEEGSNIEVDYATLFYQRDSVPTRIFSRTILNKYIAKAGRQRYISGDTFGFRYLVVKVVTGKIVLNKVQVVDRKYPFDRVGSFSCNDSLLNKLWNVCVNTIEVCSEDAYVDCADRERAQWMADGYKMNFPVSRTSLAVRDKNGQYNYSDFRLLKNMLYTMALSQLPDGRLQPMRPSMYPIEGKHGVIDDYSCLWVQAVREYYERTEDIDFIKEMWPIVDKSMNYFLNRRSERGLVNAVEFIYFDNPLRYIECEGASVNAYIYGSLRDAEYIARVIGKTDKEAYFRKAANELYENFNKYLWNESVNSYDGAIIGKKTPSMFDTPPSYSEKYTGEYFQNNHTPPTAHAALMALYYKIVPENRYDSVLIYMLNCSEENSIWWPYTSRFFIDVLYSQNNPQLDIKILNYIRKSFGHMANYETGTTSESWNGGSFVHESGAHPAYFMSAYVLGVRTEPAKEGLELIIQPRLGDLTKAEGVVVCEYGEITLKWIKSANRLDFSFTIPDDVNASVYLPFQGSKENVTLKINRDNEITNGQIIGSGKIDGRYYVKKLKGGKYSGTIIHRIS